MKKILQISAQMESIQTTKCSSAWIVSLRPTTLALLCKALVIKKKKGGVGDFGGGKELQKAKLKHIFPEVFPLPVGRLLFLSASITVGAIIGLLNVSK